MNSAARSPPPAARRPMERADFDAVEARVFAAVQKNFSTYKEVTPVLLAINMAAAGKVASIQLISVSSLFNEALGVMGKDAVGVIIERVLGAGADIVVLVNESWVAAMPWKSGGELPEGCNSVEEVPGRTEAVTAVFRTADFSTLAMYPIDRAAGALVHHPIDWSEGARLEGRFCPPAATAQ